MDKPVSEPTSREEPAPTLEQVLIDLRYGLTYDENSDGCGDVCERDAEKLMNHAADLLEMMAKDAARYRYLLSCRHIMKYGREITFYFHNRLMDEDHPDASAAIDAAMESK